MSNPSLDAAKRLLTEVTWLAVEDDHLVSIAGPDELPYLAVFSTREDAERVFPDVEYRSAEAGEPLVAAANTGTGLVLDLDQAERAVFSHSAVRDLCDLAGGADPEEEVKIADLEGEADVEVTLPDPERAPDGLIRALFNVLETVPPIARAWLVQLSDANASTLALVVERIEDEEFDGQDFANRLGWAAPSANPILLIVAGENAPLTVEQLDDWPCLFAANLEH